MSFLVDSPGSPAGALRIDLLAPNWAYNDGSSEVWIHGANFVPYSVVEFSPEGSAIPGPAARTLIDSHNLIQPFHVPASADALGVRVKTPGIEEGEGLAMTLLDRNVHQGPVVTGLDFGSIVAGGRSQIKVYGNFLNVGSAPTVVGLRTAALGTSIQFGIFYPNVIGFDTHAGVVELRTAEAPPALPVTGAPTAFVGTLTFGKFRSACRFDVSSTGPIVVKYALSLNVAPNGVISGPGTLFSARKEVPVKIRGRVSNKGVVTLTVKRGSTLLITSTGRVQGESVTATRWIGHGFGALLKGKALALQRDP